MVSFVPSRVPFVLLLLLVKRPLFLHRLMKLGFLFFFSFSCFVSIWCWMLKYKLAGLVEMVTGWDLWDWRVCAIRNLFILRIPISLVFGSPPPPPPPKKKFVRITIHSIRYGNWEPMPTEITFSEYSVWFDRISLVFLVYYYEKIKSNIFLWSSLGKRPRPKLQYWVFIFFILRPYDLVCAKEENFQSEKQK